MGVSHEPWCQPAVGGMPQVMDRKLLTILQKKSAIGNKWGPTEDDYENYSEITVQSDICVGLNASVRPQPCTP